MSSCKAFQEALRTTGHYETSPEDRPSRQARVGAFSALRYAGVIIGIMWRCAWQNLRGKFDHAAWGEICMSTVTTAERLGAVVTCEGFEQMAAHRGPVVYVSNHMSTLETLALPSILVAFGRLAIILKQSLIDIPFVGASAITLGFIAVSRKNAREDLKVVLEEGAKRLADGYSVLLFPQGTRQDVFENKRFNSLGAKLAERAGVPLVPIAVQTDFLQNGKWIKDFGPVDPSRPIRFACGPLLPAELGARQAHEQSVAFIGERLKAWGLPVA